MTMRDDSEKTYIGDDVHGQPLFVGDTFRVVEHDFVNDEVAGLEGVITGPCPFPVPEYLREAVGGEFFDAYFEGEGHKGMSTAVAEKCST